MEYLLQTSVLISLLIPWLTQKGFEAAYNQYVKDKNTDLKTWANEIK